MGIKRIGHCGYSIMILWKTDYLCDVVSSVVTHVLFFIYISLIYHLSMKFHKIIYVSAGKCRKMNRSFFVNLSASSKELNNACN